MSDDRDLGFEAHQAAMAHLGACYDAEYSDDEPVESPAIAPFCGAETCVVREVLYSAFPLLHEYSTLEQATVNAAVDRVADIWLTSPLTRRDLGARYPSVAHELNAVADLVAVVEE